ncbi:hypothetical protein DFH08DRAFT_969237 [Mycena albidolilacea]|uniref:Vomeronasal type-1 receptor n=1 Tax=Mycena albidolilacea TaxID=1033008 RepID=A0AAD6ZE75_9AGAR|nr:hypothetical protein DFH08DRAFT_971412 [Mycena albidolilacea]KAJ7323692.1 hypothetical protein DFH08DRAFT_969237 [Mycena albidolilacea]
MNLCGYILWVASSSVELLSALAAKPLPLPDSRNGSLYSPPQPTAVTGPIVVASFLHTLRMIKRRFHGVRPCLVMHHDFPVILKETISEFGRCARLVIATLGFPNTLWASRISVMFSIIRIVPHDNRSKLRKITTGFAALFALCWMGLLVQKIHLCALDKSWYKSHSPQQCHLDKGVIAFQLVTDVFADATLAVLPTALIRNATIPAGQRKYVDSPAAYRSLTRANRP